MRSSILSRSVIAVASLAIGSVALAAAPATAATPSGTTREAVLSLASSARAGGNELSEATRVAAAAILNRECGYAAERVVNPSNVNEVAPVGVDATVDGVYLAGTVRDGNGQGTNVGECSIALVAPRSAGAVLSGQGNLTVSEGLFTKTAQSTLSGDLGVTALPSATVQLVPTGFAYSANGTATTTSNVTTSERVKDKKTSKQKKAAKKKYEKRLKAAKKTYKKAVAKAGNSKSKKAAAKAKYKKARASAKAKYQKAIAGFKIVTKTTPVTDARSFDVKATSAP